MDDLKNVNPSILQMEVKIVGFLKQKIYLKGGSEGITARLQELIPYVFYGEQQLDDYSALDRADDLIRRLEKKGILFDVNFGEPAMHLTVVSFSINEEALNKLEQMLRESKEADKLPLVNHRDELDYKGEKIQFKTKQLKAIKLLVENLDSIVEREIFYKAVYDKKPDIVIKQFGIKDTYEPCDQLFKEIKTKITSNEKLRKELVCVQQDGYGIFLNKNKNHTNTN